MRVTKQKTQVPKGSVLNGIHFILHALVAISADGVQCPPPKPMMLQKIHLFEECQNHFI